jgi:hypothetical protein
MIVIGVFCLENYRDFEVMVVIRRAKHVGASSAVGDASFQSEQPTQPQLAGPSKLSFCCDPLQHNEPSFLPGPHTKPANSETQRIKANTGLLLDPNGSNGGARIIETIKSGSISQM